jgi:hypothetical protein
MFSVAKGASPAYPSERFGEGSEALTCGFLECRRQHREIMDDSVQKSCWGVTAKAVIGIAGLILVIWLFGGAETGTSAVLATAR